MNQPNQQTESEMGRVQAITEFTRGGVAATSSWARQQTESWGVPPSHVAHWIATAGALLAPSATARVELSYDAAMGLLSLDVYDGDARVYGMDDWVS